VDDTPTTLPQCEYTIPEGPLLVTADCVDPLYSSAVIDSEIDGTYPVLHRKVSGHWAGTDVDFNIYLPSSSPKPHRFFQMVYPTQDSNATEEAIAFGAASGAYTVQVSGSSGYRADAASAKLSRIKASQHYNLSRTNIYGYIYGGSGGSLQTVGALENTVGVWDGGVPIVQAVPVSIPNNLSIRALGALALRSKSDQIEAALRPGGAGDLSAVLNSGEYETLMETVRLGVPLQSWENFTDMSDVNTLTLLTEGIRGSDPTYVGDFWSEPGFLGTESSELGNVIRAELIDKVVPIERVEHDADGIPEKIILGNVSISSEKGLDFTLYADGGKTRLGPLVGVLEQRNRTLLLDTGSNNATLIGAVTADMRLRIDNRWFLAMHGYHRHQVPTRPGFYGFDQYRDSNGLALFPQRDVEYGDLVARSNAGTGTFNTHTGNVTAKLIVVASLKDIDALPWHADWYKSQVAGAMGERFHDIYRLWYIENADHHLGLVEKSRSTRVVEYTGMYQRALRDVSRWVECGTTPPESSRYTVVDSQVELSAGAAERHGVQPVVDLIATPCTASTYCMSLKVTAEAPPGGGRIVSIEWDFLGTGYFISHDFGPASSKIEAQIDHVFTNPGRFISTVRVAGQEEDLASSSFARVYNLARTSIVI
jgi:hypothetical protein